MFIGNLGGKDTQLFFTDKGLRRFFFVLHVFLFSSRNKCFCLSFRTGALGEVGRLFILRPFILYIMVCEENWFDLNQDWIKNACKIEIFLGKVLVVRKIVVPLHPQIRNTT